MFSYFGSKSKIVKRYEPPVYHTIIEPFCGSARYACRYSCNHKIWINDIDPTIYGIWKWIQQASKEDIRNLPELKKGDDIRNLDLPKPVADLLGFACCRGAATPRNVVGDWGAKSEGISRLKSQLLEMEDPFKQWQITNLNYQDIPNQQATWFIDPPYQHMGDWYKCGSDGIDYKALGEWCKERKGQVIVCEGTGADWLPFTILQKTTRRLKRKDTFAEMIWYKCDKKTGFF